jgi:hypothetical protein
MLVRVQTNASAGMSLQSHVTPVGALRSERGTNTYAPGMGSMPFGAVTMPEMVVCRPAGQKLSVWGSNAG